MPSLSKPQQKLVIRLAGSPWISKEDLDDKETKTLIKLTNNLILTMQEASLLIDDLNCIKSPCSTEREKEQRALSVARVKSIIHKYEY